MKKILMTVIAMTMMTIGFVSCSASDDELGEAVSQATILKISQISLCSATQ